MIWLGCWRFGPPTPRLWRTLLALISLRAVCPYLEEPRWRDNSWRLISLRAVAGISKSQGVRTHAGVAEVTRVEFGELAGLGVEDIKFHDTSGAARDE